MRNIIKNTANTNIQRKVSFNKDRHNEDHEEKSNFYAFLNRSSTINCAHYDISQTFKLEPEKPKKTTMSIFQSLRNILPSNKISDTKKQTIEELKISVPSDSSGLKLKTVEPKHNISVWNKMFNRNNSDERDQVITAAHRKRDSKNSKSKPTLTKQGIAMKSLYGHHDFYLQSEFADNDVEIDDSDDDIGDITPGLEYFDEQLQHEITIDDHDQKLPSSELGSWTNSDDILKSFDKLKRTNNNINLAVRRNNTGNTAKHMKVGTGGMKGKIRRKKIKPNKISGKRTNNIEIFSSKNKHLIIANKIMSDSESDYIQNDIMETKMKNDIVEKNMQKSERSKIDKENKNQLTEMSVECNDEQQNDNLESDYRKNSTEL
eukprot:461399_1